MEAETINLQYRWVNLQGDISEGLPLFDLILQNAYILEDTLFLAI